VSLRYHHRFLLLPPAAGTGKQRSLLRVLTGSHRTQLQALRGKATDEAELMALSPVVQGQR
jgi:hypothetical protein